MKTIILAGVLIVAIITFASNKRDNRTILTNSNPTLPSAVDNSLIATNTVPQSQPGATSASLKPPIKPVTKEPLPPMAEDPRGGFAITVPKSVLLRAAEVFPTSSLDADFQIIRVPKNLFVSSYPPGTKAYYLVQFIGITKPEYKNQIISRGGVFYGYIPNNAFIVKMDAAIKYKIQKLEFVRWLGTFQSAYKLDPDLITSNRTGDIKLTVLVFDQSELAATKQTIQTLGGAILPQSFGEQIKIIIDAAKIPDLANLINVMWLEETGEPEVALD
ncbi:MAG: hypothetical protein HYV42_04075 [Candidatus Magasanikbacteria bacterium]|nr:hypothetical protein [Candidatus Magasanikbacteria bacterium]